MDRLHLINLIWSKTSLVLAIVFGIWALWRGTRTERIGTGLIWFGWVASPLVQTPRPGMDVGIAIVDTMVLIGFVWLSFTTRKLWTACAAAFMLVAVACHFAPLLTPQVSLYVYITANSFWGGYALLGALLAGMLRVEKDRRIALA
ncbi:hypothetical protein PQU92_05785 [Asticcacaulis sp. BYS171W]|uniref:Uncharacterized protein n=1 Tax=Asticcacaulis aquaticus TaxID=2984212 RepID=A0ABT5HS62_9CAUL|nr:hypothetical protein [Asticcacaulis aquaticus]MDC7682777.1 hypothetical protein [Asticcacaulis aquaticus]